MEQLEEVHQHILCNTTGGVTSPACLVGRRTRVPSGACRFQIEKETTLSPTKIIPENNLVVTSSNIRRWAK